MDPTFTGARAAVEAHHLFPRRYLEWLDNAAIGAKSPKEYAPDHMAKFTPADVETMHRLHALADNWYLMEYPDFLHSRRELMSGLVEKAWLQLSGHAAAKASGASLARFIESGEDEGVEYKSTLRVNLHTGKPDEKIELSVLKTLAGLLNTGRIPLDRRPRRWRAPGSYCRRLPQ